MTPMSPKPQFSSVSILGWEGSLGATAFAVQRKEAAPSKARGAPMCQLLGPEPQTRMGLKPSTLSRPKPSPPQTVGPEPP